MGEGKTTGVNVGGSSILVIFILLCLTTFATLSMVSAGADLRLTEQAVTNSLEYYAADAAAEELLAAIDSAARQSADLEQCRQQIAKAAPQAQIEPEENGLTVRYTQPINETQELMVVLRIPGEGDSCQRQVWQVASVGEWTPQSEGFNLWDGEDGLVSMDGLPPVF